MAGRTIVGELPRHMVGVFCFRKICLMTGETIRRCAGEPPRRVTRRALCRRVCPDKGEIRLRMVEG